MAVHGSVHVQVAVIYFGGLNFSRLQTELWSRNSNFRQRLWLQASKVFTLAPASTSKVLAPAPQWFDLLKTNNHCNICTTSMPRKLGLWKRNPNFISRLQSVNVFGSSYPTLFGLRLHSPGCLCFRQVVNVDLTLCYN